MSKNFYYVLTYNILHPRVRSLLERAKMFETTESMMDFKMRSKLYMSYKEAVKHAHDDINKKIPAVFPERKESDEKQPLKIIGLMNPKMIPTSSEIAQRIFEKFGGSSEFWDEKCCSTIFLTEAGANEEEDELPTSWMFKYEVYFIEDPIELLKNGEYAFTPTNDSQTPNSTYQ
jgi:hypothetical protein